MVTRNTKLKLLCLILMVGTGWDQQCCLITMSLARTRFYLGLFARNAFRKSFYVPSNDWDCLGSVNPCWYRATCAMVSMVSLELSLILYIIHGVNQIPWEALVGFDIAPQSKDQAPVPRGQPYKQIASSRQCISFITFHEIWWPELCLHTDSVWLTLISDTGQVQISERSAQLWPLGLSCLFRSMCQL